MVKYWMTLCLAGCLRSTIVECEDGWSCPPGASCAAQPTAEVHCMPATCGDGILDEGEPCDGDLVGDAHCVDLGYDQGALQCDANCRLDASACRRHGFATVHAASERIGAFCAYDTAAGVVAHLPLTTGVVRVDSSGTSEIPVPFGAITAIACLEDQLAALSDTQLFTYDGQWTEMPPSADAIDWVALTVESAAKVVAMTSSTTRGNSTVWELSPTGWTQTSEIPAILDRLDVHAGYGLAGTSADLDLYVRTPTAWVAMTSSPGNAQYLWAVDDTQQFVATSTGVYGRTSAPSTSGWALQQGVSPGPFVGRGTEDMFVLGKDFRLAHFDGRVWSTTSGSFDDGWVAADGTFYASRGAQLVRADAVWFALIRGATQIAMTDAPEPTVVRLDPFRGTFMINEKEHNFGFAGIRTFAVVGDIGFVVGASARHALIGDVISFDKTLAQTSLDAVVAASETEAYAVGSAGELVWFRGTEWSRRPAITDVDLHAIARTPGGELVAVGDGGTILTSVDAETWTRIESGTTAALHGVWADASGVIVVGDGGTIVRRGPEGTWTKMRSRTTRDLRAVHGANDHDIIAVGNDVVVRFDGTNWTGIRTPEPGIELTSVWVTAKHLYVGSTGAAYVLRRN